MRKEKRREEEDDDEEELYSEMGFYTASICIFRGIYFCMTSISFRSLL